MPIWQQDEIKIHYETFGEGFPVLLFAPGGMHSTIDVWNRMPWNPIEVLSAHFRVIAMDQRNSGDSAAPISGSDGWATYAAAHLALLDGLGIALALLVGLPSLLYPFGPDQALFAYIGSGWLEGLWPYVDAMDHKPPGIFYVHAVLAAGFGSAAQSAIRLLEWLLLPGMGWVIAAVVVRSGRLRDGDVGAASLILAGLYFPCFDYWDSGQVESGWG